MQILDVRIKCVYRDEQSGSWTVGKNTEMKAKSKEFISDEILLDDVKRYQKANTIVYLPKGIILKHEEHEYRFRFRIYLQSDGKNSYSLKLYTD